ncbi:hypothetical protein OTU49_012845 [Cherax quadricarinatus]|uniref:B box-type domain-containing protein n=2 Tax=Cherax quadricarinatus TaxID=27406 RepID=A0AAW0VW59_CHEQU|nr:FK506-binding protein 5-like isoform X2 [Cherax quadricarinatus]
METCERHQVKLSFWCKTCEEATCGECLFEDHPTHSHCVLKAATYISEMKDSVGSITSKFIDSLDQRERWYHQQVVHCTKVINEAIRTLTVLRKDMEENRELLKGVKVVEGIAPTSALRDAAQCLALKWHLKVGDLKVSSPTKKEETTAQEEKERDDSEVQTDGSEEKRNGISEKEKEIDDSETLTEEEKKKKKKMLRVKERLAAAAAAADEAAAREEAKDKEREKDKTNDANGTATNEQEVPLTIGVARTRLLAKKYALVPREPSITPEREVRLTENPQPQEKLDKEERNREASDNRDTETQPKGETQSGTEVNTETQPLLRTDDQKEASNNTDTPNSSTTAPQTQKDSQTKLRNDPPATGLKRPRGRLARQALKRSQTMTFTPPNEDHNNTDPSKDLQSDNIRGLDLETTKTNQNAQPTVDNRDAEEQGNNETVKEEQQEKKDEGEQQEKEKNEEEETKTMFDMEPEEKERIATELLQVPSLTLVVEGTGGRLAHVTWEPMGLHVYCHQYQELPYDVVLKANVIHSLVPTKSPMVFLDVGTEQKVLGRVYISLWGHLRRASNFVHLCLGDRGPSYRNTMFLEVLNADSPGERIKGGDYDYNNGRGGEALVDDLENHEGYSMTMEAGMVTAGSPCRREQDSQFFICTEDDPHRNFTCPFGRVVSGLYVMKEAVWLVVTKQVWIKDCGLVLDIPKF